jgi:esterase/lipase superfamily enzyme
VQFFILDFRSADVDGTIVPGRLTRGTPTLDDLCACPNVVFMVHGFNVDRPTGAAELENLSKLLPGIGPGAAVAVLWPGDSNLGPASYPFETNKADDTAVELAKFIGDNLPHCPSISFAAHSLGSRVVMQTVQQLKTLGVPVDQVCLMAGAIDNNSLAGASLYRGATEYAERVAVLYSPSDTVLKFAYPAGNVLSAFMHWSATSDAALGFTGPKAASGADGDIPPVVAATAIALTAGVKHSDYIPNASGPASDKQLAAARFANLVLSGAITLTYSSSAQTPG